MLQVHVLLQWAGSRSPSERLGGWCCIIVLFALFRGNESPCRERQQFAEFRDTNMQAPGFGGDVDWVMVCVFHSAERLHQEP